MSRSTLSIALALVWKRGRLLVTLRPSTAHLGGNWEFPGGKLEAGESAESAAVREVAEEVGVACLALSLRPPIQHAYPDRTVILHPVDCAWLSGDAQPLGVTDARWVRPRELRRLQFPPANGGLVRELSDPARFPCPP